MSDPRMNSSDLESELRQFAPIEPERQIRANIERALSAPIASIRPAYSPADRRLLAAMAMGAVAALVIAVCSLDLFQSATPVTAQKPAMAGAQQTTEFLAALAAGKDPFGNTRAPAP